MIFSQYVTFMHFVKVTHETDQLDIYNLISLYLLLFSGANFCSFKLLLRYSYFTINEYLISELYFFTRSEITKNACYTVQLTPVKNLVSVAISLLYIQYLSCLLCDQKVYHHHTPFLENPLYYQPVIYTKIYQFRTFYYRLIRDTILPNLITFVSIK